MIRIHYFSAQLDLVLENEEMLENKHKRTKTLRRSCQNDPVVSLEEFPPMNSETT